MYPVPFHRNRTRLDKGELSMKDKISYSRRDFLKAAAVAGGTLHGFTILGAGSDKKERTFKVGLIGCGGRGNGALDNCIEAAKEAGVKVQLVATADAFEDRVMGTAKKHKLAPERCFHGFDAYRRLLETDVELVLMATPPLFRPLHLESCIDAGKHVFMEKPVAVDPPGARRIIAAGEKAKEKGLAIVAGTQRRHQKSYIKTYHAISQGAIGPIRGGTIFWCGGRLWFKTQGEGEPDASYMVRNWTSFTGMSGDHIVEQHVHNIDVANWYLGRLPDSALGFGGRARRKTGNQFDFFSVDLDYGDGVHIHSMCRQINGCYNRVAEFFTGAEGTAWGGGKIDSKKEVDIPRVEGHDNPYVQEHVDLLNSIMEEKPLNEARNVAESTMVAIMSRISAYTGKMVRLKEVMEIKASPYYDLKLTPTAEDFEKGPVTAPEDDVPAIPGQA